ncbi:MAG: DUF2062 domain-containing protein [Bacteroidia bacterium]|jgi:uncharacterized protein (DUF2062 family)|nr:DUF2062 domain-containing protein [Bacteroidia bacterium]
MAGGRKIDQRHELKMRPVKNRNFITNIFRKAKISLLKIYYARGSSHEIALGAAIGAFWGVFPTFGLSTILSLLLYKIFRFNILAALSAAFISNPLTSPFLLMMSFKVGTWFIKTDIEFNYDNWLDNISQLGFIMLIGSTILSSATGLLVYFITRYSIDYKRRKNKQMESAKQTAG